ncbi:MAG: crossover junction endodeoxyribonuclease RuvC [Bacillota bacterium]
MRIIGVDPGTARTGFGVIDFWADRFTVVDYGYIKTGSELPLPGRLRLIYEQLDKIIAGFRPERFAIEELFFNKNTRTAMGVGQARGVAVLTAARAGLVVAEYTPLQVKQAVVGYGRASKEQVKYMVRAILKLPAPPAPDDVTDALAVAICDAFSASGRNPFR